MRGQRTPHIPFTKELLDRDYDELYSMAKIAKKYGVSKKCIMNHMNKFNIKRSKITVSIDKVRKLASFGLTSIEIGKILGFGQAAISQIGKKNNIQITNKYHKGYILTHNGYKMIHVPDHPFKDSKGYVHLSRLIMEEYLGRYLDPFEKVHHCNENKMDNRIENLELTCLSDHNRIFHPKKSRARVAS